MTITISGGGVDHKTLGHIYIYTYLYMESPLFHIILPPHRHIKLGQSSPGPLVPAVRRHVASYHWDALCRSPGQGGAEHLSVIPTATRPDIVGFKEFFHLQKWWVFTCFYLQNMVVSSYQMVNKKGFTEFNHQFNQLSTIV